MPDIKISAFTDGGLVQNGDFVAGVRGGANYKFIFGSVAAFDIGSDIDDIPQYEDDGSGNPVLMAPALDTSQGNLFSKQQNFLSVELTADSADEIDWDVESAQNAHHTASGDVTLLDPSNMVDGGVYSFRWVQDSVTPYNLYFDDAYRFLGGDPSVSPVLGSVMIFTFRSDGMYMRGTYELFSA